jgi:putative ABC transport system permease protein
MVPVSYEFIDIKGLEFEKEDFIMNQKRIQGKCNCFRQRNCKLAFEAVEPIGKTGVYGQRFTVIGVLKKQGAPLFGESDDTSALFRLTSKAVVRR